MSRLEVSNLSADEAAEFGAVVGAFVGLGAEGEEGMEAGAMAGAEAAADGVDVFSEQDAWDVLDELPTTPLPPSSCSSTAGRSRCATRSPAPAASGSATASSVRSISWPSASCRQRRRSRAGTTETKES